ncbi:MAG: hypothetical protein ACLSCR_02105, partial [Akkermansia sp.]
MSSHQSIFQPGAWDTAQHGIIFQFFFVSLSQIFFATLKVSNVNCKDGGETSSSAGGEHKPEKPV